MTSLHYKFLQDFILSSKLDDNIITIVPTIVFLSGMFHFLFLQIHRHTTQYTRWQTRFYRDLVFHWMYFYISRIWFVFVRFSKWMLKVSDEIIEQTGYPEEIEMNQKLVHGCIFVIIFMSAICPLLLSVLKSFRTDSIPDFLIWVTEDPWIHTEIGISGHYLDRPASVPLICYKSASYRSRRSASFDRNVYVKNSKSPMKTRSMQVIH